MAYVTYHISHPVYCVTYIAISQISHPLYYCHISHASAYLVTYKYCHILHPAYRGIHLVYQLLSLM